MYKTFFLQNEPSSLGPIVFLVVYFLKLSVINILCRFKKNGSENFELQFLKIRIYGLGSLQFSAEELIERIIKPVLVKLMYLFRLKSLNSNWRSNG